MADHRLCRRCGLTFELWDMHRIEDLWVCGRCYRRWLDRQKGK